jgi:hypothetical protein
MYAGGGDPLSKSIASLMMLQDDLPEARMIVEMATAGLMFSDKPSFRSLLQDPYGLPLAKPSSPENAAGAETLQVVKEICKNREILSVLEFDGSAYEETLLEVLSSMTPFNPVFARDLWDASPMGTVDAISKAFLKTRSLQTTARGSSESTVVSKLLSAGREELKWMTWLVTNSKHDVGQIYSLFDFVESLRSRWSRAGVQIKGLTSYLPIDFEILIDNPTDVPGIRAHVVAEGTEALYEKGPLAPYIGAETREKIAEHGYRIVGQSRAAGAMRTLQRIRAWGIASPSVLELVDILAISRCGSDLSSFGDILSGVIGGDRGHRYAARIGERGAALLGARNMATYVHLDSDRCGFLSGTKDDYPVMFQEYFCYLVGLASYRWDHCRERSSLNSR